MPYILDGKSISPDAAFTHEGIQYPVGWIRRVSEDSEAEDDDEVLFSAGSTVSGTFSGTFADSGTDTVSFDL